jgi:lactoylglutathione lyase
MPSLSMKESGFALFERKELPGLLGQAPSYPDGLNGTFELAIDLPVFEDVDREFARIVNAGGKPIYGPRNEPWKMRSSMIADPDGNLIEIGSWNKGKK